MTGSRDEDAVRQFVEHVAMVLADYGFPRMSGRVVMALMTAEEDALTAGELGERLGVSPAAISGAVRQLTTLSMVVREPVPGSRADRYRLPLDHPWYGATTAKNSLLKQLSELAAEGVDAAGGPETGPGLRVAEMADFFEFAQGEMDKIVGRWVAVKEERLAERLRPADS
ncbi:GbsR/MarR family transcriptional regulator [Catenuloplanes sp. NPDC051500]|uniref:GbsR/MarR family transcriptional regulator n=1 Tax=Catenuloplanes sp. NPDC051500 TaxID=3363959 RepID=UPI0037A5A6F4